MRFGLNPITRKRLARFRAMRRAWWSFWILSSLYGLSLFANLISNDIPLLVRFEGRTKFPIVRFTPESAFTGSDRHTRPNFKGLQEDPIFADNPNNFMIFPIIPFSPHEIIPATAIDVPDEVRVVIQRVPRVGSIDFNADGTILRSTHAFGFFGLESDMQLRNQALSDLLEIPELFTEAATARFANQPMPALELSSFAHASDVPLQLSMGRFEPTARTPRIIRATLREQVSEENQRTATMIISREQLEGDIESELDADLFSPRQRTEIFTRMGQRFEGSVSDSLFETSEGQFRVRYQKEVVTFPFRPTRNHPMGLDSSGRDVLAQIIYALRTSMSFGLVLVVSTMIIGILIGAIQGYFGGWVDISGQRLIEVWSALPFLYIIILLGSIYGRSFTLLLICYGIFNWIGISYYIRAEFLRLRQQPFVEAARVMGLHNRRIILKHILPNALVPVITFFPFSLVSAIGSLAALDYLGFGLPATVPSWGVLLAQAQEFRFAWWLVLYPSLALFIVILLGVFIGEGVRSAFDPRSESRME